MRLSSGVLVTPMSTSSDKTILKFFLENSPYIKQVEVWEQLANAGSGSTDLMFCYRKDPDVLTLEIPQDKAKQSPDGHWHLCIDDSGELLCFFAPGNDS